MFCFGDMHSGECLSFFGLESVFGLAPKLLLAQLPKKLPKLSRNISTHDGVENSVQLVELLTFLRPGGLFDGNCNDI